MFRRRGIHLVPRPVPVAVGGECDRLQIADLMRRHDAAVDRRARQRHEEDEARHAPPLHMRIRALSGNRVGIGNARLILDGR